MAMMGLDKKASWVRVDASGALVDVRYQTWLVECGVMPQGADTDLDLTTRGTISGTGSKPQAVNVLSGS
jgi:hypothetical protein